MATGMGIREEMLARLMVVLTVMALVPLAIFGRMLYLNFQEGATLRARGERQLLTRQSIPAMRGLMVDRAGRLLAVNTARYDLALDPEDPGFRRIAPDFYARLARLTGRSREDYLRRVRRRVSPRYVLLQRDLPEAHKEAIENWVAEWKALLKQKATRTLGILLQPRFDRRYTYAETAAHLVGYVSADLRGLAGLERQYDDWLRGEAGWRKVQRDRRGRIKAVVGGLEKEPRHGRSLVLALDLVLQAMVEEELARGVQAMEARWGTAVAMDPKTGAILALANYPTYDPNRPSAFPVAHRRNHAITDKLEPGSTFKLVPAVAALEQGLVTLEDTVDTGDGWAVFHGRTMKDVHAYGRISFADVLVHSSNVGMARVARRIPPGIFYQYARNFGFGQPTWVDLPGEVAGALRKPATWSGITQTWMSIGYAVEVTPLQLLAAYAALANGGKLMQPYVVAEVRDVEGRTLWKARPTVIREVMRPETARALLPVFEQVVLRGTGKRARVEGVRIAGKTGTAQKVVDGQYRQAYRASFVGFFPVEDPQVVLLVLLDEPRKAYYGGEVAAPIFRRIVERWLALVPDILPEETSMPAVVQTAVPDVRGEVVLHAATRIRALGLHPVWAGDAPFRRVVGVVPSPGDSVEVGTRVVLETSGETGEELPDFKGWLARDAVAYLQYLGRPFRVQGHGQVYDVERTGNHITLLAR